MAEQLKVLDKYPIRTRLSLTGTLIVARVIAHGKLSFFFTKFILSNQNDCISVSRST